jgi:hypothetical protein
MLDGVVKQNLQISFGALIRASHLVKLRQLIAVWSSFRITYDSVASGKVSHTEHGNDGENNQKHTLRELQGEI